MRLRVEFTCLRHLAAHSVQVPHAVRMAGSYVSASMKLARALPLSPARWSTMPCRTDIALTEQCTGARDQFGRFPIALRFYGFGGSVTTIFTACLTWTTSLSAKRPPRDTFPSFVRRTGHIRAPCSPLPRRRTILPIFRWRASTSASAAQLHQAPFCSYTASVIYSHVHIPTSSLTSAHSLHTSASSSTPLLFSSLAVIAWRGRADLLQSQAAVSLAPAARIVAVPPMVLSAACFCFASSSTAFSDCAAWVSISRRVQQVRLRVLRRAPTSLVIRARGVVSLGIRRHRLRGLRFLHQGGKLVGRASERCSIFKDYHASLGGGLHCLVIYSATSSSLPGLWPA